MSVTSHTTWVVAYRSLFSLLLSGRFQGPTMIKSAHLWAVAFDDIDRAEQVRAEVVKLGETQSLILLDTAVAVRYPDGIVTLNGEPFVCVPRVDHYSFASYLVGLALAVPPLSAPAVGALERAAGRAADAGIGDDFIEEVQALIKPNTSAVFVLDQEGDMQEILKCIRGLGGTILKTNVDMERARLVQSTLAAADARSGVQQ